MMKKMILLLLILTVGVGIYWFEMHPEKSDSSLTLYGNVDIRELNLAFRISGRVSDVNVDEGDQIKPGDILATVDPQPFLNSLHTAEAMVDAVSARNKLLHKGYRTEDILQRKAKVQAAQVTLREKERHLVRQKELIPEEATTRHALDTAQSLRDQAEAMLKVEEEQLRLASSGFRPEEIAESDAQLKQAQANLDSAKLALSDTALIAPSHGIVLTRSVEIGSMVQTGAPAFAISLTHPVWVRAYVDEPQLGQFATGTKVTLLTDSRPAQPYHGVVGFVSPTAEFTPKSVETTDLRTALVYRLRIIVEDPDIQLRQGMPVTVKLIR